MLGWQLVLAGMRPSEEEEEETRSLIDIMVWQLLDAEVAEVAGEFGRQWLPSHRSIDSADLAIAATAVRLGAELLTGNVGHFPMFPDLVPRY